MAVPVEVFEDAAKAADAAAEAIAAAVAAGLSARGRASLVMTGGRTPGSIYDRLARLPLDWSRVWITLSDERCVPEDSPASNTRLLRERLLVGSAAGASLVPLGRVAEMPRPFDLVLLGMGEDGHVASLFPGNPALAEGMAGRTPTVNVPAGQGVSPAEDRVSLSMPTLLDARQIVIFITGEAKRAMVQRDGLPVSAVLAGPAPVRVIWSP
jgi:6-phosphogluconolactonase